MIEPLAVAYSTVAGAGATALGALPIVAIRSLSHRIHDTLLAFSAGLMGAIVLFQLLPEGFRTAQGQTLGPILGLALGGITLFALDRATRHLPMPRPFWRDRPELRNARTGFLVFVALSIHNVPEGLSTGLGYGHGVTPFGNALALGIALQNVPEGLIVAVSLRGDGHSRFAAFALAALTGVVEPLSAVMAMLAVDLSAVILPLGLGLAAGAMAYVILAEMIPESYKHGYHREATIAVILGVLIVIFLSIFAADGARNGLIH
ncbi:MAG TPA: ZIP family metal transporter [Nitrospiria bacterium]